uniref:fructose-bisphosphatase n=1 Tax=Parascaris univalens TaxID=6257 RepID=A0A915ADB8_PARUN
MEKESSYECDALTLQRILMHNQRAHPQASGDLSNLLTSLLTAIKEISAVVRREGLARTVHEQELAGGKAIQTDFSKPLPQLCHELMVHILKSSHSTCAIASENSKDLIIVEPERQGKYIVAVDPLDGASNIGCLASIGTIFGIFKKTTEGPVTEADVLQSGRQMLAAGYALYGSATSVVISTGNGVNSYLLDPSVGEFILVHRDLKMPSKGKMYSINEGNAAGWPKAIADYVHTRKFPEGGKPPMALRYIGSMVPDVHRTLLYGGIFIYPAVASAPEGKLRMLYEVLPIAFLIEQAGGMATNGKEMVMDLKPSSIHAKCPAVLGSREDVEEFMSFVKKHEQ